MTLEGLSQEQLAGLSSQMPQLVTAQAESEVAASVRRLPLFEPRHLGSVNVGPTSNWPAQWPTDPFYPKPVPLVQAAVQGETWYPGPAMQPQAMNTGLTRPPTWFYKERELRQQKLRPDFWRSPRRRYSAFVHRGDLAGTMDFIRRQDPLVGAAIVFGGAMVLAVAVGSIAVALMGDGGEHDSED